MLKPAPVFKGCFFQEGKPPHTRLTSTFHLALRWGWGRKLAGADTKISAETAGQAPGVVLPIRETQPGLDPAPPAGFWALLRRLRGPSLQAHGSSVPFPAVPGRLLLHPTHTCPSRQPARPTAAVPLSLQSILLLLVTLSETRLAPSQGCLLQWLHLGSIPLREQVSPEVRGHPPGVGTTWSCCCPRRPCCYGEDLHPSTRSCSPSLRGTDNGAVPMGLPPAQRQKPAPKCAGEGERRLLRSPRYFQLGPVSSRGSS